MTRVLSELLGAEEPMFHQGLARLEAASGHTSADIRLSAELVRATQNKIHALGLDPRDTTGMELYAALQQKIQADDAHLSLVLNEKYGDTLPIHKLIGKTLADVPVPKSCFALRLAVGKRLLKKSPPKQTMKALGYRSFDSMIRREHVLAVYAAAWLLEAASWRKAMIDGYKKLSAADFEIRPIIIETPQSKHWQILAGQLVTQKKHNIVGFKEFGALVILPLPTVQPPAVTLTTLLVALYEMNEIRSASTYLKLNQVRLDFGAVLQAAVAGEPKLPATMLDGTVPWYIVQRYYARYTDRFRSALFEPHVQQEDLSWHSVERALSHIDPTLDFWHHTATLGLVHDHRPVSLNVVDAALNFCNQLPYTSRLVHYFRHNLWSELMIRYLKHDSVEQAVVSSIEPGLYDSKTLA